MQLEFPWLKEQDAALGTTTMEAAVEESCCGPGAAADGSNAGPIWARLGPDGPWSWLLGICLYCLSAGPGDGGGRPYVWRSGSSSLSQVQG
jgi:hypothetical protein